MKFETVAEAFQEISRYTSRLEITRLLADLFARATPEEAQIISYLSLGLLRAPYKGTQFALADKSIKKILAELLPISLEDIEEKAAWHGDLGIVFKEESKNTGSSDLSVADVYQTLIALEEVGGSGSQEEKRSILKTLLKKLLPEIGSLIIRIVLGKLRLGFSDMTLIDALSWMLAGNKSLHTDIENAYNICADIGLIAQKVKADGLDGLKDVTIQFGIPVRPAGAERAASSEEIIERIGEGAAQPKIDGFRLQIHKQGKTVHFFSRNLQDMSAMFPDLVAALQKLPVDNYIIEGEAVAYDEQTQTFLPFQQTIKRKRKHEIATVAEELPLTFFIFDLLYIENQSWLNRPYRERRKELIKLFGIKIGSTISVIPEVEVDSAKMLEHYFLNALADGFEGLVVKKLDSPYQAGKRNFNWIKLKRTEGTHLEDSIDAVIVGYYAGGGKRAAFGIGAFLVAVYDAQQDKFKTVAKIGTGLSDEQWQDLKRACDQYVVKEQPKNLLCDPVLKPLAWVSPELVCEIRADELTISPVHTAGLALRFPRFIQMRKDKTAQQATTVEELERLYKLSHSNK